MSNNRLVFEGLEELRAQLRALPDELTGEASNIIDATANAAAVELRTGYQRKIKGRGTGNLVKGVVLSRIDRGRFTAGVIVKSTAKHASIFEFGTQTRKTDLGYDRGAMPPGNVAIPIFERQRRGMYERLKAMLARHGLTVIGNG